MFGNKINTQLIIRATNNVLMNNKNVMEKKKEKGIGHMYIFNF